MICLCAIATETDKDKSRAIYEENYLNMYHIALGITKNQSDAENAVQEAFLALAEKFEKYSHLNGREMSGLCVSIMKNKIIDAIRRKKRYSEDELEHLVLFDECREHNAPFMAEREEEKAFVQKALKQIPEIFRETLVLKYCYELSIREIARIQGVSTKTVDMRIYRGKMKFREVWNELER